MTTEDDIKAMLESIEDLNDNYKKLIKNQITDIQNGIKSGKLHGDDLKNRLIMAKAQIEGIKNFKEFNDVVKSSTKTLGESVGELGSIAAKAGTNIAKSFFGGAEDPLATSGALFNAGINEMNVVAQAGANGLVRLGDKISKTNPKLGMLATAFGDATSLFSSAASDIAKEGMGLLLKETKKLITDFQTLSTVGAIYADGLTTLKQLTINAYMTTDQFTKAVMTNKDNFTKAGIGVVEGSKRMAGALKAGGPEMRDALFNLGMSMNDQADAVAIVMARMAGPMGKLIATDAEIADATADYAENLKVISDITGKTAKEQEEAAKARSSSLNMQIEIAKMGKEFGPKVSAQFQAALGGMGEVESKAMQDRMAFNGQVIDKNTALMESMSPSLKAYHQAQYNLARQGKLTGEEDMRLHAQYAARIQDEMASQKALAIAGSVAGSSVEGLTKAMGENMQSNARFVGVNVDAMIAAKKAAEHNKKDVTAGQLQAAIQDQQMKIQGLVNDHLGEFSKVLLDTTKALTKMMDAISHPSQTLDEAKNWAKMNFGQKVETGVSKTIETVGSIADTLSFGAIDAALGAIANTSIAQIKENRIAQDTAYLNPTTSATTALPTIASTGTAPKVSQAALSSPTAEKQQATTHLDKLSSNSTETNSLLRDNNDLLRRLLQSNQQIHNAVS